VRLRFDSLRDIGALLLAAPARALLSSLLDGAWSG